MAMFIPWPKPCTGTPKLLLAFDIGTTYSSVSYCILVPHGTPVVLTVARFPGQGITCPNSKIPSALYYDKHGAVRAAGAEALNVVETARSEGWTRAEWWKLHLCPRDVSSVNIPPLPPGKSVLDILTDFIRYLFECAKAYIQDAHSASIWLSVEGSMEYILTYPGGWDKSLYLRAFERTGLVPSTLEAQTRVRLLAEGEASLYYRTSEIFHRDAQANQAVPQGIAVIDAGGGIINLRMCSVTMTSDTICCEEIVPAESRMQGSVFISCRARALIERKLKGWESLDHSREDDISRFTQEFDRTTKLVIENERKPAYVNIGGRHTHSSRHGVLSGQLKLSGEEATGLFNDSVDAIIDAFEQQEQYTEVPITTALVVGGLSANQWVWSQLESYFTAKNIRIYRPYDHSSKVVATGAVLYATTLTRSMDAPSIRTFWDPLTRVSCNKERFGRKIATLGQVVSRVHTVVKKCNMWEWLSPAVEDPIHIYSPRKLVCLDNFRGCLSLPRWARTPQDASVREKWMSWSGLDYLGQTRMGKSISHFENDWHAKQ